MSTEPYKLEEPFKATAWSREDGKGRKVLSFTITREKMPLVRVTLYQDEMPDILDDAERDPRVKARWPNNQERKPVPLSRIEPLAGLIVGALPALFPNMARTPEEEF